MNVALTDMLFMPIRALINPGAFLFALLFAVHPAYAGQATVAWDANPDPAVAGYMVYYSQTSGNYSGKIDAGKQTAYTVPNLQDGRTYYYAVTAYDLARAESAFSNEVSATVSSTSVGTPTASPSAGSTQGGGGGGGCATGTSTRFDPTFPIVLLVAIWHVRRRKQASGASKEYLTPTV